MTCKLGCDRHGEVEKGIRPSRELDQIDDQDHYYDFPRRFYVEESNVVIIGTIVVYD